MSIELSRDREAWIPISLRVLNGDFKNADRSTNESLRIGLRSIEHPECLKAHEQLVLLIPKSVKISECAKRNEHQT
jgi:hypothetical protein